jgi:hypothetical protein
MENKNMALWDRVKTIDPKYTKNANLKGQNITTFSFQSVVMMATQQFGMFGHGWGYEVKDERFDEGAVITQAATYEDANGKQVHDNEVKEVTHTLLVSFWYMLDGKKIECPIQAGHTPYLMKTKYGPKHDDEYYKKTLADAVKKSLSMLGFGADIFLGLNDDPHYMAMMQEQKQLQEQAALPEQINELAERVKQQCKLFESNSVPHSVKAMANNYENEIMSKARQLGVNPKPYLDKVKAAYDKRIEQLKSNNGEK